MATVINNPSGSSDSGNGMSFIVGVVLLVALVFMFLYFGLPLLNRAGSGVNSGGGAPQINVPPRLDVNINKPQ